MLHRAPQTRRNDAPRSQAVRPVHATFRLALVAVMVLAVGTSGAFAGSRFRRGDGDGDGTVSITDALATVRHLFLGEGPPACPDGADADDNGRLQITDAIATLGFLFLGEAPPPAPGPLACGDDPTFDTLAPCVSETCPGDSFPPVVEFEAGELRLPSDRTGDVAASFAAGRIRAALASVFDSPGDSVTLKLGGGASVAIVPGVPLQVSVEHEPVITLREDGVYEIAMSYEMAAGIGLELVDGVEASVEQSQGVDFIFTFEDLDATVAAVQGILVGEILAPLAGAAEDGVRAFEDAARALEDALAELDAARAIEAERQRARDAAAATVRSIRSELDGVRSALSDAQDDVDRLAGAVGNALADFACKVLGRCDEADALRAALSAARREVARLRDEVAELERELLSAERAADAAEAALGAAIAVVRAVEEAVEATREAFESARREVGGWRQILDALDTERRNLAVSLSAFELHAGPGANIEAFLSPFPGVTLEGAGVGASASTGIDLGLRLDIGTGGGIDRVELSVAGTGDLVARAGLGVGAEGSASLALTAVLGFGSSSGQFALEDRTMELALDTRALLVAGIGLTAKYGVGREVAVEFDLEQADAIAQSLWGLVADGDVESLASTLLGVEATFRAQDRRVAAGVAAAGASWVGYGASLEGSCTWDDRGPLSRKTVSAGELVGELFAEEAVSDTLDLLGGALETAAR